MRIFNSINGFEPKNHPTAVALGFFDGVHLGHREVIKAAAREKDKLLSTVLSFSQNPLTALGLGAPSMLTSNDKKARLIESLGIDALVLADFTELKDMTSKEFVSEILKKTLNAKKVYCGFNYHFGSDRADGDRLKALCEENGIEAAVSKPVCYGDRLVSSTVIRSLIEQGDVKAANEMLGSPYSIDGVVKKGNRIGSSLGFPTVNIPIDSRMALPRFGVYQSRITIGDKSYIGATNIGVHPSIKEAAFPVCETFIPDFDGGDVYGENVSCELISFIRGEKRFSSLDELKAQIKKDIEMIKALGT